MSTPAPSAVRPYGALVTVAARVAAGACATATAGAAATRPTRVAVRIPFDMWSLPACRRAREPPDGKAGSGAGANGGPPIRYAPPDRLHPLATPPPTPAGPRSSARAALLMGALAALLTLAAQWLTVACNHGGDWSALFVEGADYPAAPALAWEGHRRIEGT